MARQPGIYGPYRHGNRWRTLTRYRDGSEEWQSFARRDLAQLHIDETRQAAQSVGHLISQALDAFKLHLQAVRSFQSDSIETHIGALRRLHGSTAEIEQVTPDAARRLYRAFAVGRAVATHQSALAMAKFMWRWLVEEWWARRNPFADVEPEGIAKAGKPQLTIDEARRFDAVAVKLASREPGAVAAMCALELGLRASEIARLRVRDLDDGGKVVRITRGKTRRSIRALEVQEPLRGLLGQLAHNRAPIDFLFPGADEGHRGRMWVYRHVRAICEAAGVQPVSPHGLRGTFSTMAQSTGVATRAVSDALGHVSTSMTLGHYTDQGVVDREEQKRRMGVLRGGKD